jgi:uncharacterized protein YjbI with pentapeptide repeats
LEWDASGRKDSFRRADLHGADLRGLNRGKTQDADRAADHSYTNLTNAGREGANLTNANLLFADLPNADLLLDNLSGADLPNANLTKANLTGADLTRAKRSLNTLSGGHPLGGSLWLVHAQRGISVQTSAKMP